MAQIQQADRLPPEDAIFLYLEKAEMPLHIGNVLIFDGAIPLEAFIAHVESKLPLIPRYRQRIEFPSMNLSHPAWVDDPGFDIRRHIRRVSLKNGTDAEMRELAGRVFAEIMDSRRPLWDVTLVDGLQRGRTAMIARVHHCLADGVAGTGLLRLVLSDEPVIPEPPKAEPFHATESDAAACLAEALANLAFDAASSLLRVQAATLSLAQALVGNHAAASVEQWAGLAADMVEAMEPLPINVPCKGPRRHLWTDFDEREIAAIRGVCGGTVNDVVLTLLTLAARKHAELRGEAVEKRLLRIAVPVNLRSPSEAIGMGNRISLLPLVVPLDARPPAAMLKVVRERMQALKRSHVVELINLAAAWLGTIPAPLQAMLGQIGNRVPIAPFHMVCTNVPGSRLPLYLLGRKMLRSYPYVPIGNEMGFCCAVQNYNGRVYFGLTVDSEGIPDADRLLGFVNEAFQDLSVAAGIEPKPVKSAKRRVPRRKPATRSRRTAQPVPEETVAATGRIQPKARPKAAAERARRRTRPRPLVSEGQQPITEVPQEPLSTEEPLEIVTAPPVEPETQEPEATIEAQVSEETSVPAESIPAVATAAIQSRKRRARQQPTAEAPPEPVNEIAISELAEAQTGETEAPALEALIAKHGMAEVAAPAATSAASPEEVTAEAEAGPETSEDVVGEPVLAG